MVLYLRTMCQRNTALAIAGVACAALTAFIFPGSWYLTLEPDQEHARDSHLARAKRILKTTPLVDGHNDFPILVRQQLHNQIYDYKLDELVLGTQTDFHKMEAGMMGGQFWSVFMPCPPSSTEAAPDVS